MRSACTLSFTRVYDEAQANHAELDCAFSFFLTRPMPHSWWARLFCCLSQLLCIPWSARFVKALGVAVYCVGLRLASTFLDGPEYSRHSFCSLRSCCTFRIAAQACPQCPAFPHLRCCEQTPVASDAASVKMHAVQLCCGGFSCALVVELAGSSVVLQLRLQLRLR